MDSKSRREFIKQSLIGTAAAVAGSAAAQGRLKLCILFGDRADRPPAEIAPGFDLAEVPIYLQLIPMERRDFWAKKKAEIASWKLPPIKVSSHFIPDGPITGPDVDTEWLDLWLKRAFSRLSEMGVEVTGIYGDFFPVPQGFPRAKAREQALRFANQVADYAKQHKILIALEPTAIPETVFPMYLDGLAFCKELARPEVRLMADMAYFLRGNQPFDHIAKAPEMCLNCHIQGDKGQPGVGDMLKYHTRMFSIFKDIGYTRAVSCACPWIDTTGSGKMQFGIETAKTLKYLQNLRDKVYGS